jgi:2-polyprenyl-3-methyl-5-hydroxy-6-metoxy-1,4-benzoquinol methylase
MKTLKQAKYALKSAASSLGLTKGVVTASKEDWQATAQEFEFGFHKDNSFRQTAAFDRETEELFVSFGFSRQQYAGNVVMDIGAGSKLRGKFFEGSRIVALEPLARRFMEEIAWCDLKDAAEVYSQPAEECISKLKESADFIFSINVLDHCFDFETVLRNLYSYAKHGGSVFLSFDCHFTTSLGHPLVLTEKTCTAVFGRCGFIVDKFQSGFSAGYERRRGKNGYDGASTCLNYWLRKP